MTSSKNILRSCSNALSVVAISGLFGVLLVGSRMEASDHADPMDLTRLKPLEPVITDLFVFPVDDKGQPAFPFERQDDISLHKPEVAKRPELTPDKLANIKALVVILCVRRALTQSGSLNLEPYTYRVHMDTRSKVSYDNSPSDIDQALPGAGMGYAPAAERKGRPTGQEARARYGGTVEHPENISDDVLIEIALRNDATLNGFKVVRGLVGADPEHVSLGELDPARISVWSGIRDDPFIFPAFFGTNVVAMVIHIPTSGFRADQRDWLVWATSHRGNQQIDHVGRSLRTQNPRFELLNTLHPQKHAAAIKREHENPGLLRDIAVRANIQSLFAFREWDFVPDVMVYTNRFPVGFPNGRLLTDDVAALLAQHGDTLLLELSHHNAQWPRRTTNDKAFLEKFPYLAEPWPDRKPSEPYHLSRKNTLILWTFGLVAAAIVALAIIQLWQIIRWLLGLKPRRSYL